MTEKSDRQPDKFRELARDLECDESEERFEEAVRKIAPKDGDTARKGDAELSRRLKDEG